MKAKRASRAILYVVLTIIALYTLSPLAFLLINSFKTQPEIVSAPLALPSSWDFGHLTGAAEQINFWKALAITALVTLTSVALLVVVSSLSAWMMVRNHTRFSNVLLLMFTAAMLVPFQAVMYPLISLMENLQLKNLLGLIIMYGGFGLSLSVFLYHGFIKSVPRSVEEAAVIDGHGNYFKCNVDLERLSAAFFSHRQFRFQNPDPGNLLCQNAFRAIWKSLGINFSRSLSFHHSYHHRLFISAKILCQGRIRRRSENVEITVP